MFNYSTGDIDRRLNSRDERIKKLEDEMKILKACIGDSKNIHESTTQIIANLQRIVASLNKPGLNTSYGLPLKG